LLDARVVDRADARIAVLGDDVPGNICGSSPVDPARAGILPRSRSRLRGGHHVGELTEHLGELLGVPERETARRHVRETTAGTALTGSRTGIVRATTGFVVRAVRHAETER